MKLEQNAKLIASKFSSGNCGVFGKKRKGKDVIFQKVIKTRKKPYYSNIDYGVGLVEKISPNELKLGENTYNDFINGTIKKFERRFYEKVDIYNSDAGNIFPSQYEKELDLKYKGVPLFESLQGHAYDSNSHWNWNGSYTRLWKKIREQIDDMFKAVTRIVIPYFAIFVKVRYFEKPESAELNLLPYKKNKMLDSKQNKALKDQYYATHGMIIDMWIKCSWKDLSYDTRAFEKVLFNDNSERRYLRGKELLKVMKQGDRGIVRHPFHLILKRIKTFIKSIKKTSKKV